MWETIREIIVVLSPLAAIGTFFMIFVKPVREKLLGTKAIREGQRCILRSDMLHTYYKHKEEEKIRQYELENFLLEYAAYKSLDGNSFVDSIKNVVVTWEVGS